MFSVLLFHIYTYLYLFLIIFSRAWRLWEGFTLGGTFVVTVHTHGEFGPNKLFIPFFFFFFLFFHSVLTLFMLYILYIDYIYVCIYYSMLIQTFDDSCSTTNKTHEKALCGVDDDISPTLSWRLFPLTTIRAYCCLMPPSLLQASWIKLPTSLPAVSVCWFI